MVPLTTLNAQNLGVYSDYKNYFFVFDDGKITQAEYLPVQSFKVGGNAIAYIDNSSNLKVVYKGEVTTLADGLVSKYLASDYLVSYSTNQALKVFDSGKTVKLTNFAESYSTGDSLVAFYDSQAKSFKVYYRGEIILLENDMLEPPVKNFKTGDNIFAYVNYLDQFKLFYRGEIIKVKTSNRPLPYEAGKNIVAYYDDTYNFKAFYNGLTYDLETFQPKSFVAGDDMVAYVDNNEQLKVFYDGEIKTISSFAPVFYKVEDSLLVYNEANRFKVFYKGTIFTLENYIPTNYRIDFNTLVYLDQQGRLKAFYNGQSVLITNVSVDQFELYRNVITYKVSNSNHVYCKSKIY